MREHCRESCLCSLSFNNFSFSFCSLFFLSLLLSLFFGSSCLWSHSFSHNPKPVTTGDGWHVDLLVTQKLQLLAQHPPLLQSLVQCYLLLSLTNPKLFPHMDWSPERFYPEELGIETILLCQLSTIVQSLCNVLLSQCMSGACLCQETQNQKNGNIRYKILHLLVWAKTTDVLISFFFGPRSNTNFLILGIGRAKSWFPNSRW